MGHAWLDSLSEDWVSQPESDASPAQLPSLKTTPLKPADKPALKAKASTPSRIPRRALGSRLPVSSPRDSSYVALNERTANEINKSLPRATSKLSHESKIPQGLASRSVSAATNGSVVHNTVHQKSSPEKGKGDTPEWKRRLVYGNMQYGEQRDLFCSAAVGLQDMFKPPSPSKDNSDADTEDQQESVMPSSPPGYPRRIVTGDLHEGEHLDTIEDLDEEDEPLYPNDVTPSPSPRRAPREIKYRLNVDDSMCSSQPDDSIPPESETPSRQPEGVRRDGPSLSAPEDQGANARTISGQSYIRNEDFSPILIGKHSSQDGKVDFAPIEVPAEQLKNKLERLRINQMLLDPQADPHEGFDASGQDGSGAMENTDDYARNGGFLNMQRGGRSMDNSFRFRALSPGLGGDTSEMLPEESLQASTPKQFPSVRTEMTNPYENDYFSMSPAMPKAPFPSPAKKPTSATIAPSSGSPLKLFGPYDTFTNQTLLRRISQFEEGLSGTASPQSTASNPNDSPSAPSVALTMMSEPQKPLHDLPQQPLPRSRAVSQFGAGDFDGFEFSGDVSYTSHDDSALADKENAHPNPLSSHPVEPIFQLPPRPQSPDEESELVVRRRRNKSVTSSSSRRTRTTSSSSQMLRSISPAKGAPEVTPTPQREGSEGKRQRGSPSKDPTPKRRRTLHRAEVAVGREDQFVAVDAAHHQMQSVMGKKRKDARPGDFQVANPDIIAMRSILRPRTPTPSQRSSQQREEHPFAEQGAERTDGQLETSKLKAVQNLSPEVPVEADRKPSIRTQDFVDQAAQIMAMIRNQVRPPGLANLEESEAEHGTPDPEDFDDSYQESTKEPFSRPPSREGRPLPRIPNRQDDPELIKRLKKYQELSDMGDVITSSMRSMGLAQDAIRAAQEVERQIEERSRNRSAGSYVTDDDVISDPPNIRISTNPHYTGLSRSPVRDYPTHSSTASSNRTYPTTSSRGSDSRKIIMPESVSHLIPDRVGSMFLDKQNNIWIKKKETQPARSSNILPSEDSEDDPFASIPDLSVDMTKEMQHLLLTTAQKARLQSSPGRASSPVSPSKSPQARAARRFVTLSPNSELSPDISTLAREEIEKLDARASLRVDEPEKEAGEVDIQGDKESNPSSTTRRRNLTISFSSPVASIIQDVVAEDLDSLDDDLPSDADLTTNPTAKKSPRYPSVGKSALKNAGQGSARGSHLFSRQLAQDGPGFIPRPVSRIDEQDEESTIEIPIQDQRQISFVGETSLIAHKTPDARRASLSFLVNGTPANGLISIPGDESALIGQNVGKLSLSPLSEFTVNNSDQSFGFEVSYVMGRRHMATGDGTKKVMSMTIRDLVDKLSEVEPFEPYWEDITELDLQEKRLASLHMLDEFCGKLVTLDVSKNTLGHLDGVPSSVRQLKVSYNMLTELTSWDHLMNLQYVDISGNEVKSLSALKKLVHLRSIKADNNQLTSLDGLDMHDGLLALRARDNQIGEVDLAGIHMDRLTELDLGGNRITSIRNLDHLPSLTTLKLGNNQLQSFVVEETISKLRKLDLSDNRLTSLDISNLPALQSLHVDRNCIREITGFGRARHLDSLSLREQKNEGPLDLSFLSRAYEIRKLFLSGNYLGAFEPKVDFLNLQLLELANCGLQRLPAELGQLMPNLRTLNLNFNGISDLSPLQFIPRLKKLLAAGNRLADSTLVTELLTDFPHLTQLDLRDNPVTMGFYAPVQILVASGHAGSIDPFVLPDMDVDRDETFASRLDETTRLRRRLHQIVFVASCKKLRVLDGLPILRQRVLSKDSLYETLVAEGLLPDETLVGDAESPQKDVAREAQAEAAYQTSSLRSSIWNAEDSFA